MASCSLMATSGPSSAFLRRGGAGPLPPATAGPPATAVPGRPPEYPAALFDAVIGRAPRAAVPIRPGPAVPWRDPDAAGGASWLNSSSFAVGLKEDAVAV